MTCARQAKEDARARGESGAFLTPTRVFSHDSLRSPLEMKSFLTGRSSCVGPGHRSGIHYLEFEIHGVDSRIPRCLGLLYIGRDDGHCIVRELSTA